MGTVWDQGLLGEWIAALQGLLESPSPVTVLVLVLLAGIELAGRGSWWLSLVAAVYFFGRIAHGFGMDGGKAQVGRMIGTLTTMLVQLGLAVVAALVAAGVL